MTIRTPYYIQGNGRQDSECVFFVEGTDDAYFLSKLLEEINADPEKNGIVDVGGTAQFVPRLQAFLKAPSFTQGRNKKIAVVCDADNNAQAIAASISNALVRAGQPALTLGGHATNTKGIVFGLFTMPDSINSGDLESLCLSSVAGHPIAAMAATFMASATSHATAAGKVISGSLTKREAQVYLAGIPNDLARGAGRGYSTGAFQNSHAALDPIRDFLKATIV